MTNWQPPLVVLGATILNYFMLLMRILICITAVPVGYLVLYWWFIPEGMQTSFLPKPPATIYKIFLSFLFIFLFFLSALNLEIFAKKLKPARALSCYRIAFVFYVLLYVPAGIGILILMTPLVNDWMPPRDWVFSIFCLCAAYSFSRQILYSFGPFVRAPRLAKSSQSILENLKGRRPVIFLRSFSEEKRRATLAGRFSYANHVPSLFLFAQRLTSLRRMIRALENDSWRQLKRHFYVISTSVHNEQAYFSDYFSLIGTYVAIRRPGEVDSTRDLGAIKFQVSDEKWRDEIFQILKKAIVVIVELGDSDGLMWEIEQVKALVDPMRVLLIVNSVEAYGLFSEKWERIFNKKLPRVCEVAMFMFDSEWSCIALENSTFILEDAVKPFIYRLVDLGIIERIPE